MTATETTATASITLPAPELGRILGNALLATAPAKDARPVLSSVHVVCGAAGLLIEATDSYWLLRETITAGAFDETGGGFDILIDQRDLAPVIKALKARDARSADATVAVDDAWATFHIGSFANFAVRFLDAEWPNVDRLLDDWRLAQESTTPAFGGGLLAKVGKVVPSSDSGLAEHGHPVQILPGESVLKPARMVWQSTTGHELSALVATVRVS